MLPTFVDVELASKFVIRCNLGEDKTSMGAPRLGTTSARLSDERESAVRVSVGALGRLNAREKLLEGRKMSFRMVNWRGSGQRATAGAAESANAPTALKTQKILRGRRVLSDCAETKGKTRGTNVPLASCAKGF